LLHKSLPRDIRDVNAVVTEEDLKRVATYVSEKRYDSEYVINIMFFLNVASSLNSSGLHGIALVLLRAIALN
jgi:hypothetical protein